MFLSEIESEFGEPGGTPLPIIPRSTPPPPSSHYTMPEKQQPLNCVLVVLEKRNQQDLAIFLGCFDKTIIPLALIGYEMIIASFALSVIS